MARRRTATAPDLDDFQAPPPGLEDKPARRIDEAKDAPAPRRIDGWEAVEEIFTSGNSDIDRKKELRLKLDETTVLIKFLEPAPFDALASHWVEEITSGRKMFRCPKQDCPLCDEMDHKPRRFAVFHVGVWNAKDKAWDYRVWEVGSKLMKKLKALAKDERKGPLDNPRLYIEAKRTGAGLDTEYFADPIREGDAELDWSCKLLRGEALEDLKGQEFDGDWMSVEKPDVLRAAVDSVLNTQAPARAKADDGWGSDDEPPF